jgi:hypothetical protein
VRRFITRNRYVWGALVFSIGLINWLLFIPVAANPRSESARCEGVGPYELTLYRSRLVKSCKVSTIHYHPGFTGQS